jgi:exonuclease III
MHNKRPDIIIMTETRVEDRTYNGKGVFRGFELVQHSTSGRRVGGVTVFARKRSWTPFPGTIRNSGSGHFTIGAYECNGEKIIIGGIYGDCTSSDRPSADIFNEYEEWHRELRDRLGNIHTIIAGDFNLKMDVEANYKPRAVRIVKSIMEDFGLDDAGGEMRMPTWRLLIYPRAAAG